MADQLDEGLRNAWDHTPPRLTHSAGNGGRTPRLSAAATPPPRPTLTETFNQAADPKVQIKLLRRKLSRPTPTLEYGVKGSVVRSLTPRRDRQIQATIEALSRAMSQTVQSIQTPKFELGQKMAITPIFNKHARRKP